MAHGPLVLLLLRNVPEYISNRSLLCWDLMLSNKFCLRSDEPYINQLCNWDFDSDH